MILLRPKSNFYLNSLASLRRSMLLLVVLVIFIVNFNVGLGDFTMKSPQVTNWGSWGEWQYCPSGMYATGFKLKTEREQDGGDDTALNAILLYCTLPGQNIDYTEWISSAESEFGNWGNEFRCREGMLTGFQLRSESNQGGGDDTAANNLRMFCSNPDTKVIEGDGQSWGVWTAEQKCVKKQGICGLRIQIEGNQGSGDDTALNNVDMRCCDIVSPATTCHPKDSWEKVVSCTNKGSSNSLTCEYAYTRGITTGSSSSSSSTSEWGSLQSVGFSVGSEIFGVKANFEAKLEFSQKTSHSWSSETSSTWTEGKKFTAKFEVPPGVRADLMQVVGVCGDFMAYTMEFSLHQYDLRGNAMMHKTISLEQVQTGKFE